MFKQLEQVPDLNKLELETIDFWKSLDIVNLLKKEREDKNAKLRIYYDGPITANGMPHYGHAITWTMKDVIPRHWSMQGHLVYRNMGWDCQGIPVEYEVEKELKFEKKEDIEKYGVAKFNELCRQSVLKYRDAMFDYESKLGRWFDETQIYSTMEPNYIESVWWSLKMLYEKGYLYEGYKIVAYSTRAGTTLSTHEVNDGGYKEFEDPYITVKFKLTNAQKLKQISNSIESDKEIYALAWTTTPWTIPGNLLLSVGKDITYSLVLYENDYYVLADARVEPIFENRDYSVVVSGMKADVLLGMEYQPVFPYFEKKKNEGCFKIIEATHTNIEEGTGLVHLAPYGVEDFEVFENLNIPVFDYLDETAKFKPEIPEYEGLFYKDADEKIIDDLIKNNSLFDHGKLVHRMPVCWRTGTPLIYKPVKSWYLAVSKIKDKMIKENQKINWIPEHLKDGNSGIWINNARDWAISRSRYWGTPLPVWENDKTGEKVVVGSFEELNKLSGVKLTDPHKPFVDEITWNDQKNGGVFRRIKDVIDVWYDSASMPFAQFHYPFENPEIFKKFFPAEYISEGIDQVRLWFYVTHVVGVALFDEVPYKNVVATGIMLNEEGKRMSKSKRNYKPMDDIIKTYGGDVLRYFILNSPLVYGIDVAFSENYLIDARKEFFLPLWNSLKYLILYAIEFDFDTNGNEYQKTQNVLDLWIIARLKETQKATHSNLDKYLVMDAARLLAPLINDLSTWYIRRSRDRIKEGDLFAISTLYYVLSEISLLIAPFYPFLSEVMYQTLNLDKKTGIKSVHLNMYSKFTDLTEEEYSLLRKMKYTRDIIPLALSLRIASAIKVRQPLSSIYIQDKGTIQLDYYEDLIKDEVNLKSVIHLSDKNDNDKLKSYAKSENEIAVVWLDTNITNELRLEGSMREFIRNIQDKRKELGLNISDRISITYPSQNNEYEFMNLYQDEVKRKLGAVSIHAGEDLKVEKV